MKRRPWGKAPHERRAEEGQTRPTAAPDLRLLAAKTPSVLNASALLTMQRLAGNSAVTRLLLPVQRRVEISEAEWAYKPELFEQKKSPEDQFKSDAAIWFHTLFHREKSLKPDERRRTRHQQYLLRRHFLAMASLGVEAKAASGRFSPFEKDGVPLAALASHGGRFAYESSSKGVGERFHNLLLGGDRQKKPDIAKKFKKVGGTGKSEGAGLFKRISTHGQEHTEKGWRETQAKGAPGLGMNFAFGGTGHTVKDTKNKTTTIGPEGWAAKGKKAAGYQLGTAFFKQDYATVGGRLMVGFEGTSPRADNQLGASHGVIASVLGAAFGIKKFKNERSLTGQAKAGTVGLPSGMGATRAIVNRDKLKKFQRAVDALEAVRLRDRAGRKAAEELFKDLLTSTSQGERDIVLAKMAEVKRLLDDGHERDADRVLAALARSPDARRRPGSTLTQLAART